MSTRKKSEGKQPLVRHLVTLDENILNEVKAKYSAFNLSMFVRDSLVFMLMVRNSETHTVEWSSKDIQV